MISHDGIGLYILFQTLHVASLVLDNEYFQQLHEFNSYIIFKLMKVMLALTGFYIISVMPHIVLDILSSLHLINVTIFHDEYSDTFAMWSGIFSWSNIIVYTVISRYVHISYSYRGDEIKQKEC